MIRSLPPLALCLLLAACRNDDTEEVTALEGRASVQDSVVAAQRAALDGLRTFRLRHRATDKAYFDPIVERLSHSFAG